MDPLPPAAEHQNVLDNISKFTQAVRQLLAGSDIDRESELKVQEMLELLETSTAEAMKEAEQLLISTEQAANEVRGKLTAAEAPRTKETVPPAPAPPAAVATDPQMGYRLGFDLLRNFGYLSATAAGNAEEYRTILDWVRESISVAAKPQTSASPARTEAHPTPANQESIPISQATSRPSPHIDLGWTTWLASTHVHADVPQEAKKPDAPEDLWRDLFN